MPSEANAAASYINGSLHAIEGDSLVSVNPARPDEVVWQGSPALGHVDLAVQAARGAAVAWGRASMDERIEVLRRWQAVTEAHKERIARVITAEMGKTLAESRAEAGLLGGKVDITLGPESLSRVSEYAVEVNASRDGHCRFKPHGVMAVIGPFNFPAHLPNGHWVPAMLLGNTIVFKPSEKTPAVGQLMAELMDEAEVPPGVFNLVQGAGDIAASLVSHDDIDGVLFTGSWPVGRKILEANLDRPDRIIALEMGGNNPAVIMPSAHMKQAVVECVRAGFATTGQRCTCTRRIILHEAIAEQFMSAFCKAATMVIVGPGDLDSPVFMGPIVSDDARQAVLDHQEQLAAQGGKVLVEASKLDSDGYFITPGVVEVDGFSLDTDCEVFGPLVQVTIVDSLDAAIEQANATRYGLAASIFTDDDGEYEAFFAGVKAGCINRNTGTAGASSKLPFGGTGHSGNHRPAAAFAVDYCAYPIANMVERGESVSLPAGMPWSDGWIDT